MFDTQKIDFMDMTLKYIVVYNITVSIGVGCMFHIITVKDLLYCITIREGFLFPSNCVNCVPQLKNAE